MTVVMAMTEDISIHIPRAGDDFDPPQLCPRLINFNPHPPCGG